MPTVIIWEDDHSDDLQFDLADYPTRELKCEISQRESRILNAATRANKRAQRLLRRIVSRWNAAHPVLRQTANPPFDLLAYAQVDPRCPVNRVTFFFPQVLVPPYSQGALTDIKPPIPDAEPPHE